MENRLYFGDNLEVLKTHISDNSIDLIYLDPPFKSNQNYNVLFEEHDGTRSKAQIKAFEDTWSWDQGAEEAYQEIVATGGKVSEAMQAFRGYLGENDMMAYLAMMAPRLVELKRVLKESGSIYLHCDPTASHYLKMLMDAVFEPKNFRNEIVWHYRRWTGRSKRFQRMHDVVFFYTRTNEYTFNPLLTPYTKGSVERKMQGVLHRFKRGEEPLLVSTGELQAEGVPENDVWHIPFVAPSAKERLGYPTQKPEALLERIIKASSNEGDVVLDPFCGCGTTVSVAERLNRNWIGIDITHLAVTLIKHRLQDAFGKEIKLEVIGEPEDISGAETLARDDPYQFQWWALGLVGARPVEQKKGADKGIDGRIYFFDDREGKKVAQIIFSVKGGHVGSSQVRDLRGVIEREKAAIGVFITMGNPTSKMKAEAATAGLYESENWGKFPRLQIFTIKELLDGKKIECPPLRQTDKTFQKAQRVKKETGKQEELF